MRVFSVLIALLLIESSFFYNVRAVELYSIIYSECRAHTGLIINVNEEQFLLLGVHGEFLMLPRRSVETILIYNTVENPVSRIALASQSWVFPRKVTVHGNPDFSFVGWPIRFLEDLIVFYDIQGKSHLVNVEQIKRFESENAIEERLISFKRAGASAIVTYFADYIAQKLR